MNKRELLDALNPYGNDQYVCVLLHTTNQETVRVQLAIQAIVSCPPWHGSDGSNDLIGIVCHEQNKEVTQ